MKHSDSFAAGHATATAEAEAKVKGLVERQLLSSDHVLAETHAKIVTAFAAELEAEVAGYKEMADDMTAVSFRRKMPKDNDIALPVRFTIFDNKPLVADANHVIVCEVCRPFGARSAKDYEAVGNQIVAALNHPAPSPWTRIDSVEDLPNVEGRYLWSRRNEVGAFVQWFSPKALSNSFYVKEYQAYMPIPPYQPQQAETETK